MVSLGCISLGQSRPIYRVIIGELMIVTLRDVAYESYKTYHRGPTPIEAANFSEPTRVGLAAVQRATFQSIASM
jgi:hypothetical protein